MANVLEANARPVRKVVAAIVPLRAGNAVERARSIMEDCATVDRR